MGIFDGVLLASDYDGTLADRSGCIPQRVREAVAAFTAQGGRFTVCTGRTYQGFHAFDPSLINAPVLLANGGMIYDYHREEIVLTAGLGEEAVPALREVHRRFPGVSIEMYAFGETFCINVHDQAHRHFTSQDIPYREIQDPAEATGPWAKVMFGGTPQEIAEIQRYLPAHHPELGFVPTGGGYLEVLRPGMNKGTLLRMLAQRLGIRMEDAYAIGDGSNDVDMLCAAAKAFVPANGDPAAMACASYVVCSNDEGAVADAIGILREIYAAR